MKLCFSDIIIYIYLYKYVKSFSVKPCVKKGLSYD